MTATWWQTSSTPRALARAAFEFTLEGEGLNHVRIVNAYGQTVYNADLEGDQAHIDLSQMGKGIYMMHIEANGGHAVRKVVVE